MNNYSIKRLSKINTSNTVNPTTRKYFLTNCKSKITESNPTSKGWIDIVKTLKIKEENDKSRVFQSILDEHEQIVVKIGDSDKIEHEYLISKVLSEFDGFVKYYCFFTCEGDYLTVEKTLCDGPGTKMKVIIMPYYKFQSILSYKWTDINQLHSVLQQTVLNLIKANHKIGFIHGDMHIGNILLEETDDSMILYDIEEFGFHVIPTYGMKGLIMDFEKSDLEKKNPIAFDEAIYIRDIYFDLKKLFYFTLDEIKGNIDFKTLEPITIYISALIIKGHRISKTNIDEILLLINDIQFANTK